jgi:hypothetical protein
MPAMLAALRCLRQPSGELTFSEWMASDLSKLDLQVIQIDGAHRQRPGSGGCARARSDHLEA